MSNNTRKAEKHLSAADPLMARLIAQIGSLDQTTSSPGAASEEHYGALVRAIVGQQLSRFAARAINARLVARYDGHAPTPAQILAEDPDELKAAAGLSRAKVSYLRSLAEHVERGELQLASLPDRPDDEVIRELVAVKGLGEWTAQMFLMFHLGRPDVLPTADLGIRKAMQLHYPSAALPKPPEMISIAEPWRPFRTLACLYLWRSLDSPTKPAPEPTARPRRPKPA